MVNGTEFFPILSPEYYTYLRQNHFAKTCVKAQGYIHCVSRARTHTMMCQLNLNITSNSNQLSPLIIQAHIPRCWRNSWFEDLLAWLSTTQCFNPFTPKSDQFQISPSHHTVWRTCLLSFHSLLRWEVIKLLPILTTSLIHFSLKGWENLLFEPGSESVTFFVSVW